MPVANGPSGFETAIARADEIARSLQRTAEQARNVEELTGKLAGAGSEQAAATEQIRAAAEGVASTIEETASVTQSLVRSQQANVVVGDIKRNLFGGTLHRRRNRLGVFRGRFRLRHPASHAPGIYAHSQHHCEHGRHPDHQVPWDHRASPSWLRTASIPAVTDSATACW